MPVTARFLADYTTFTEATEKATLTLRAFATEPAKVERALSRMTETFTGKKLIADATLAAEAIERIGGTSKLTEDELKRVATQAQAAAEKLRLMGEDVPDKIARLAAAVKPLPEQLSLTDRAASALSGSFSRLAAAFGIGALIDRAAFALVNWTKEAVASGGVIADLASKTGLSTDELQRMQFVAAQTSTSLDSFTKAAFQLGVRIAGGEGSVKRAVEDMGLSFEAIRQLKPDDQFGAIVQALEQMTDAQRRNNDATAVFGKQAQEILPAIQQGYTQLAQGVQTMSTADIQALDRAGDAWDRFMENRKTAFASNSALILRGIQSVYDWINAESKVEAETKAAAASQKVLDDAIRGTSEALDDATDKTNKLEKAERGLKTLSESLREEHHALMEEYARTEATLIGKDVIDRAETLLTVLQRMDSSGLKPIKGEFDNIVKSMTDAQAAMASTGRAGEEMYQRLEAARRRFSGLTPEGLLQSKNIPVGLGQAPGLETGPSEMGNLLQDIERAIDLENEWNATIDETQVAAEGTVDAHKEATAAAVEAATQGRDSYRQLKEAILEASAALKVAVPLAFSWTEAYKAAGFFVNDVGAFGGLRPRSANGGAMMVNNVTVNASGFQTPASLQQMGDEIGRVLTSRAGRA